MEVSEIMKLYSDTFGKENKSQESWDAFMKLLMDRNIIDVNTFQHTNNTKDASDMRENNNKIIPSFYQFINESITQDELNALPSLTFDELINTDKIRINVGGDDDAVYDKVKNNMGFTRWKSERTELTDRDMVRIIDGFVSDKELTMVKNGRTINIIPVGHMKNEIDAKESHDTFIGYYQKIFKNKPESESEFATFLDKAVDGGLITKDEHSKIMKVYVEDASEREAGTEENEGV